MPQSDRPKGSSEARSHERLAARAGRVRIALGALGTLCTLFVAQVAAFRPLLVGYLAAALVFQWLIQRRVFRSVTRAVLMGIVDTFVISFIVQRLGSQTSTLALAYVVTPVLYATSTPRRRIPIILALVG
ncbi:MAG: hypothetical protein ACHQ53_13670, partial [Polyangiales bacterium]